MFVWFYLFSPIFHLFDFLLYFQEKFNPSIKVISAIIRVFILWLFLFLDHSIMFHGSTIFSYFSEYIVFHRKDSFQFLSQIWSINWFAFSLAPHSPATVCNFLSSTKSSIHITSSKTCISFIYMLLALPMLVNLFIYFLKFFFFQSFTHIFSPLLERNKEKHVQSLDLIGSLLSKFLKTLNLQV